jgi:hypothetical protein
MKGGKAGQNSGEAAPEFLRFEHTRAPYAIELERELVQRLSEEIARHAAEGVEIGGLLIGSFPRAATLTLRIQDFFLIERRTGDDAQYNLTAEQRARLSTTRHNLIQQQRSVLGFFRSHMRREKLALSAEDRDLLSTEFRRAIHTVLLVKAKSPYEAAFFVTDAEGVLQAGPPLPDFQFTAGDVFKTLPPPTAQPLPLPIAPPAHPPVEQPETAPATIHQTATLPPRKAFWLGSALAGCALLLCLAFTVAAPLTARLLPSQRSLHLTVADQEGMLEVRWNHHQSDLQHASGATLTIRDGTQERRLTLTTPELRYGSVSYRPRNPQVEFRLSVALPDSLELAQAVAWHR